MTGVTAASPAAPRETPRVSAGADGRPHHQRASRTRTRKPRR
jgi:hypothetical protein